MADDDQTTASDKDELIIPAEVKEKFPDLVQMILDSESMDNEERRYWFSVLPIMTEDQVKELRDILETEKKKLAEIDAKYENPGAPQQELTEEDLAKAEEKRIEAREKRKEEEKKHQEEEKEDAEALLGELDDL